MVRRKPGELLPLEYSILDAATSSSRGGDVEFHGFEIARRIRDQEGARRLTAHGTLYKALGRMETAGLLESRWEDPDRASAEGRPRRRLYSVTALGAAAHAHARSGAAEHGEPRWQPGLAT
ncbi:MAG: PadR family transcriptional regulator [Acidimicrobiia bacterium]|nr:PadR family transcriptional regulator [Acidimicrobiia bacterium]